MRETVDQITPAKLKTAIMIPKAEIILNGLIERLVIPSIASENIFLKGYLLLPATLSLRS